MTPLVQALSNHGFHAEDPSTQEHADYLVMKRMLFRFWIGIDRGEITFDFIRRNGYSVDITQLLAKYKILDAPNLIVADRPYWNDGDRREHRNLLDSRLAEMLNKNWSEIESIMAIEYEEN